MTQLLIATKNEHKIIEYKAMLSPLGFELLTLYDFPDLPPIEETGDTFAANAFIKAQTLHEVTGTDVVADDSGLVVDALNGAPGVFSARYAGEQATYIDNNRQLLSDMASINKRDAYFITVICLVRDGQPPCYVEGRLEGAIARMHRGTNGFGYDPIFVLPDGRHLAELSLAEKNTLSHRARALHQLVHHLDRNESIKNL